MTAEPMPLPHLSSARSEGDQVLADQEAARGPAPLSGSEDGHACSLLLFASGVSTSSARAIDNVRLLCKQHLRGAFRLSVIDVHQCPEVARDRGVLATPTLLREDVVPELMRVGDFSDHQVVLSALGLRTQPAPSQTSAPGG